MQFHFRLAFDTDLSFYLKRIVKENVKFSDSVQLAFYCTFSFPLKEN